MTEFDLLVTEVVKTIFRNEEAEMKDSLSLLKDIQQMAEKAETIEIFREMLMEG